MRYLVAALVLLVAGCSADDPAGQTSADCSAQIRVDDQVFTSYTFADLAATKHGTADLAECEDVGEDARGSVFPDDPRQRQTWVFAGYSPDEVLGVKLGKIGFGVYLADSLSSAERDRIIAELSPPSR